MPTSQWTLLHLLSRVLSSWQAQGQQYQLLPVTCAASRTGCTTACAAAALSNDARC